MRSATPSARTYVALDGAPALLVPGYNLFGLAVSSVTASAYARSVGRMLIGASYWASGFWSTKSTRRRWDGLEVVVQG